MLRWLQRRRERKELERLEQLILSEPEPEKSEVEDSVDEFLVGHLSKQYMVPKRESAALAANSAYSKDSPVQDLVRNEESNRVYVYANPSVLNAYVTHEAAGRGVNLLVDALASIDVDAKNAVDPDTQEPLAIRPIHNREEAPGERKLKDRRIEKKKLIKLLNYQPNLFQSKVELFQAFWLDFFLYGNAFLFFDGTALYHLKAQYMEVVPGKTKAIDKYIYDGQRELRPNQVIHIKDNNTIRSSYFGRSRLESAALSLDIMTKMSSFQRNFFKNGAILGIILSSPNVLSPKVKAKVLGMWQARYNPTNGGRRPHILDGGLKVEDVGKSTYKDLDFDVGYKSRETRVLKALGVPPVLLESGNNANLRPNMKLLYELTVLPAFDKLTKALEVYFGYDIEPIMQKIAALQPETQEQSRSLVGLINAGAITVNEARAQLRLPKLSVTESGVNPDDLRVPANIAGSAVDPSQGGRPQGTGGEED